MTIVGYLQALLAMALALSLLMAMAWVVQQRSGNSGWVDTIWTFSVGLVGAAGAIWPVEGAAPHARQWLVAVLVVVWSLLGMAVAQMPWLAASGLYQAIFYVVAGLGWVLPAMPIVSWMSKPDA
jgi:steroid 5-alpha reductase family enzyme